MAKAIAAADNEKEINSLKARIDSLTAHLDKAYMNKLSSVLDEADFQRICAKINADRAALERWLSQLDRPDYSPAEQMDLAKKLTERFLENASANREPLVSLIEHVKLTANKQLSSNFSSNNWKPTQTGAKSQTALFTIPGALCIAPRLL